MSALLEASSSTSNSHFYTELLPPDPTEAFGNDNLAFLEPRCNVLCDSSDDDVFDVAPIKDVISASEIVRMYLLIEK